MFRLRKFTEYLKESELYPQVNNGEAYMIDGEDIVPHICSLMSSMMDYDCNFKEEDIPDIYFNDDPQESTKPAFRRTGSYFPDTNSIIVYVHPLHTSLSTRINIKIRGGIYIQQQTDSVKTMTEQLKK